MVTLTGTEILSVQGTYGNGKPSGEEFVCTTQDIADLGAGGGSVTSVTGTTNRITSTGGTTPVIDISASYVGQSSITTLGTIGTGTWQGTAIGVAYGGTGLASGTSGGLLYFSGATTLASSGALTANAVLKGGGAGAAPSASGVSLDGSNNATGFGTIASAAHVITSAAAQAFAVGPNGGTNPVLAVLGTGSPTAGIEILADTNNVLLRGTNSGSNTTVQVQTKGSGNFEFNSNFGGTIFSFGGDYSLRPGGTIRYGLTNSGAVHSFSTATLATASSARFLYTGAANTTLTASTDFNQVYFNLGQTNQHATGAITTQRDMRITPMTHSAVASSTITDAYGLYIDSGPVAGTNVTITNTWALGLGGKLLVNTSDATTGITSFPQVAGGAYMGMNWTAGATTGVRFGVIGYGQHSGNGNITSTGHLGGILGFAQKTGTGTDALVIGVEGRIGASTGTITTGAAVTATFDTNTEDAGTITDGIGFYVPDQTDSAHITNKYSFLSVSSDFVLRNNGPSTLFGKITQDTTITPPGTTGARTINKPQGRVNFAAGATSLVVTNSLVTASSGIFVQQAGIDTVMVSAYAVPGPGSFTIVAVGTPAAEVPVHFWVTS